MMTQIALTDGTFVEQRQVKSIHSTEHEGVVQIELDDGSLHFAFAPANEAAIREYADACPRHPHKPHEATEYLRRDALVAGANEAHRRAVEAGKRLARTKRPAKWLIKAIAAIAECTGPLSSDLAEYRDAVGKKIDK